MSTEIPNEEPRKPRRNSKASVDPDKGAEWAAAAADAEASKEPDWDWSELEDVIDITLTDRDMADLLRANGADEEAKSEVDRTIDALKAELKEKKAESEAIAARMKDRNRSGAKGVQSRKAIWKIGTCFSLNTVQYLDPQTGEKVFERPLSASERQLELGIERAMAAVAPAPQAIVEDDESLTDPEALLRAAEDGDSLAAVPSTNSVADGFDADDMDEDFE